ncbi:unnamed protein product [Musa acuminata subsp. malaccensis]|uniref:(wild Malaysian banana) hypothetical protein n=1 Tax=Musa acuminata subsp. malaccensis TaxID=214687 RepID=A0A804JL96_MUSAM|nr:unnamed protein product [Musa acuminata subsp. malaccensis]
MSCAALLVYAFRFVPPDEFKLALLTLELDFVKEKTNRTEQLDAVLIAPQLQKRFIDQMTHPYHFFELT